MLSFQEKEGSHTITNLLFYLCCSTGQRVLWTYVQACNHLEDGFSLQRLSEAQPPSHQVLTNRYYRCCSDVHWLKQSGSAALLSFMNLTRATKLKPLLNGVLELWNEVLHTSLLEV